MLPRDSPQLNLVERKHLDLKNIIAKNPGIMLSEAVMTMNTNPKIHGIDTKLSPADLYTKNDQANIENFNSIRIFRSKKRTEKSIELRGRTINQYHKEAAVGQIAKFSKLNDRYSIKFGKIVLVEGKILTIEEFGSNRKYKILIDKVEVLPSDWETKIKTLIR